jgi:mono/diheme cytochrome c family protein
MSIGTAASAGTPREPQPDPAAQRLNGAYLFKTYCASCHGARAMGDGPLASSMRRRPPNLTEIARRNNGVFPAELINQVIDGRRPVRGHGGPDMPVWGDAFLRTTEGGTEEGVKLKIQALVAFLESVQMRDGF